MARRRVAKTSDVADGAWQPMAGHGSVSNAHAPDSPDDPDRGDGGRVRRVCFE